MALSKKGSRGSCKISLTVVSQLMSSFPCFLSNYFKGFQSQTSYSYPPLNQLTAEGVEKKYFNMVKNQIKSFLVNKNIKYSECSSFKQKFFTSFKHDLSRETFPHFIASSAHSRIVTFVQGKYGLKSRGFLFQKQISPSVSAIYQGSIP